MGLEKAATEKPSVNNPLEQFVLLAKGAKGAAAVELVKQALDAPGVYVFGELLDIPNIKDLENSKFSNVYQLLQVFAHGTYKDYINNSEQLPALTDAQTKKLQHLTIVSLATKLNCIPYSLLLKEVNISNVRQLEDLIIDAIYADIIRGKLDQKNSCLEVDFAIGRDFKAEDLLAMIDTLTEWCNSCESVLSEVDSQIVKANSQKAKFMQHRAAIEKELLDLKMSHKASADDVDDILANDRLSNLEKPKKLKQPKLSRGKFCPRSDFMRK